MWRVLSHATNIAACRGGGASALATLEEAPVQVLNWFLEITRGLQTISDIHRKQKPSVPIVCDLLEEPCLCITGPLLYGEVKPVKTFAHSGLNVSIFMNFLLLYERLGGVCVFFFFFLHNFDSSVYYVRGQSHITDGSWMIIYSCLFKRLEKVQWILCFYLPLF